MMVSDMHIEIGEELFAAYRAQRRVNFGMECSAAQKDQRTRDQQQSGKYFVQPVTSHFSPDLLRRLMPIHAPPSAPAPYSRLPRNRASAPTLPAVSFCHALRATTCRSCGNAPVGASLPCESPLRTLSRPAGPQAARRRGAEAARGMISALAAQITIRARSRDRL